MHYIFNYHHNIIFMQININEGGVNFYNTKRVETECSFILLFDLDDSNSVSESGPTLPACHYHYFTA